MESENKIEITVKIVGHLKKYISENKNELNLQLREESKIIDLLKILGIPEKEIKYIMILVNRQPASKETVINSGDRISFLTLSEGG